MMCTVLPDWFSQEKEERGQDGGEARLDDGIERG